MATRKTNKRSMAAKKAVQTRRNRNDFHNRYGITAQVAQDILMNPAMHSRTIAEAYNLTVGTVAAVKANLNRVGLFSNMAYSCNYCR